MRRTNMHCVTTATMVIRQVMVHVRAAVEASLSRSHARILPRYRATLPWRVRHVDAVMTHHWPTHGPNAHRLIRFADDVLLGRMKPVLKPAVCPAPCKQMGRC